MIEQSTQKAEIDFLAMEKKWQNEWEKQKIFEVKEDSKKKKFYVLEMFPYPSGAGLHMGHALNYTIGDIQARFRRMNGFNVLYPMGYDAFGLPAENAAIKVNEHPRDYTRKSIANFITQQKALGLSYDWSKLVKTCEPEYYKWNQYFFLKFLEKGLVQKKKAAVNWCPKCNTVLANEQVHSGKCWRHEDTEAEIKHLEQWFIKTTDYADELLKMVDGLEWPERIKSMQKNWIGKSFGTEIEFVINGKKWPIFTTRPDTIFGVTFMVVSAQHAKLDELVTKEQRKEVDLFLRKIKSTSEKDATELEKEGAFTGAYAINPMTGEKIPVYAGNFVVADYGSGMVMAVPAHDQRDYEFAVKYKIPIKQVIAPNINEYKENEKTLSVFDSIYKLAKEKGIKVWLLGGLSCAFHVGLIYRSHSDIDLIVKDSSSADKVIEVFSLLGFELVEKKKLTDKLTNFVYKNKNGVEVDIGPRINEFGLVDSDFEENEKELNGVKGLVLSKRFVESFKEKQVKSRKAEKDLVDLSYLQGKAFTEEGVLVNSKEFDGIESEKAIEEITNYLESKKIGKKTFNFKLRDWLVSRQRYWGTPIPIIYCKKCGAVAVPEKDLPVELPYEVKFGEGNPLKTNKEFVNCKCPKCGSVAERETDTMDTFFDSSWYYLRYPDNENAKEPFKKANAKYWMPVDQYIGGAEHACMHLIYARFFSKALRDMGYLDFDEPFTKLFNQGMLHGADGNKMSKSLGNVVNPLEIIQKFSADSLRFNLMSLSAPNSDSVWSDKGMESAYKFLQRLYAILSEVKLGSSSKLIQSKVNRTVKEVTLEIDLFKYNLGIIKLRSLVDSIVLEKEIAKEDFEKVVKLFHPICPHITEELWNLRAKKSLLSIEGWPVADESKIDDHLERIEEIVALVRTDILKIKGLAKLDKVSKVKMFVSPEWKWVALEIVKKACGVKPDFGVAMKALMANPEMKKHGAEIQPFLKTAINRLNEISEMEKFDEIAVLNEAKSMLEKEFGSIEVILAEKSSEAKAKNAFPGKPALLIE
ncbi:MAG: leucine--tRNA ligase [archaeon]